MHKHVLWALLALVPVSSRAEECRPRSFPELAECLESRSLERTASEQSLRSAERLPGVARQWANPELGVESVHKGAEKGETTASLLFALPLGGKRGAEIDAAEAELTAARAGRDLAVAGHALELRLALHRLGHLRAEITIAQEALGTYGKIVAQFEKKAGLSPEQQVSLSVFRMALAETELRMVKLRAEQEKKLLELTADTGVARGTIEAQLPARREDWPEIADAPLRESAPQLRKAYGERAAAESLLSQARASAWPELKIGPAFKLTKDGGGTDSYFGAAIAFPLPILSWNGGAKSVAEAKLAEGELGVERARRKTAALRAGLVRKYRDTTRVLRKTLSAKSVEKNHEQMERLFFRGLVPSSLVIEAHRQLLELAERQNEAELDAVEALGWVRIIDNEEEGR